MKEVTGARAEGQARRQALGGDQAHQKFAVKRISGGEASRVNFLSNFCFCFLSSQVSGLGLCLGRGTVWHWGGAVG